MTITTLCTTSRAHNLHTITVRAGKSIMLLDATIDSRGNCVPSSVK